MEDIPATVKFNGKVARRDYQAEHVKVPATAGWPIECVASGVMPAQAGELRAEFKRLGVGCEVTNSGDPVYTSKSHREQCIKARGLHDNNSYC